MKLKDEDRIKQLRLALAAIIAQSHKNNSHKFNVMKMQDIASEALLADNVGKVMEYN
jgi:hypothetical protein